MQRRLVSALAGGLGRTLEPGEVRAQTAERPQGSYFPKSNEFKRNGERSWHRSRTCGHTVDMGDVDELPPPFDHFRYVGYSASADQPNVVVDGSPNHGTVLTLTHWPGYPQPPGFHFDLSAQMAFHTSIDRSIILAPRS